MANLDIEEATRQADALLGGAVDEFVKPLIIPDFNITDTARATETLNRAEVSGGEQATTIRKSSEAYAGATEAEKQALTTEGEAGAIKAKEAGIRAKQEAEGYQYFQRLFGVDLAPDSAIATAAHAQTELRSSLVAKRDNITKMQQSNLIDSPLEYIMDAFRLPGAVQDYNATVDKVNSLQNSIEEGITTARNAGDLNNKGIATISDATAAANANIALAEAAKAKAAADAKLATTSIDFATRQLTSDLALANATRETTQLDMQNERLKYESMVNAIRFADTHAVRLESAAKLLLDIANQRSLDVLLRQYDRNVGNPENTTNRQLFNRLPAKDRDNIAAIGAGSAGTNPYEFLLNFNHPGPNLSPETGRLLNFVQEKAAAIKINPLAPKETHPQLYALELKADIEKEEKSAWKQGSIFYEMSPAKMIANGSVPEGSQLAKVLEPLAAYSGPVPTTTVVSTIAKAYPNPTEAGQIIADYYRRNIELRNKSLNMSLMGMKAPEEYKVPMKFAIGQDLYVPGGTFDLTKPAEATKFLILKQARDKAKGIRFEGGPGISSIDFETPSLASIDVANMTESQAKTIAKGQVVSDTEPPASYQNRLPKAYPSTDRTMGKEIPIRSRDLGILNDTSQTPLMRGEPNPKVSM